MSSDSEILSFLKTWIEVGLYVINGKRDAIVIKEQLQPIINEPEAEPVREDWEKEIVRRLRRAIMADDKNVKCEYSQFYGPLNDSFEDITFRINEVPVCFIRKYSAVIGWRGVFKNLIIHSPVRHDVSLIHEVPLISEDRIFFNMLFEDFKQKEKDEKINRIKTAFFNALPGGIQFKG